MNAQTKTSPAVATALASTPDEGTIRLIDWAVRYFEGNDPGELQGLFDDFDFGELATSIADEAERKASKHPA